MPFISFTMLVAPYCVLFHTYIQLMCHIVVGIEFVETSSVAASPTNGKALIIMLHNSI